MSLSTISQPTRDFIASLPADVKAKLAVRYAQQRAQRSAGTNPLLAEIQSGGICFLAAAEQFGDKPARELFEQAGVKVV